MLILSSVISFFVIIFILTLAHELGHLIAAKAAKLKVEEFGVGFPPRLISIIRGKTRYSLNILPLGGFVKIAGQEDPTVFGGLASKGIRVRLIVLSAGALMNALVPFLLFSTANIIPHRVNMGRVIVVGVFLNSPAWEAGIQPRDAILDVDGNQVRNINDLQVYFQLNLGKNTTVIIEHANGTVENVYITPQLRFPKGQNTTGLVVDEINTTTVTRSYTFGRAISLGVQEYIETIILFKNETALWFVRSAVPVVMGPVGIAHLSGEIAREGISQLMDFAAFVSINLAFVNLIPLPASDGGRIFFVILEWFRQGKRVPPRVETLAHGIGFAMLLALVLVITYYDIVRIINA